jgi:hypothetical protein
VTVDDNYNDKLFTMFNKTNKNSDSKFKHLSSRNSFTLVIYKLE